MSYDLFWKGNKLKSSADNWIAFDTETEVTEDKDRFPQFVLATAYDGETNCVIGPHQLIDFLTLHKDGYFVGHNWAFDFWVVLDQVKRVIGTEEESDLPVHSCITGWWNAASENRMADTMLLDQLLWLAKGKGEAGQGEEKFFRRGLDKIVKEYLGIKVDKEVGNEQGDYRLRFAELLKVPVDKWATDVDPGFFEYATTDTKVTYEAYKIMRKQALELQEPFLKEKGVMYPDAIERFGPLTEAIQVKGSIALAKISKNGMMVDLEKAKTLEDEIRKECEEFIPFLEQNFPHLLQPYKKKEGYKVAAKSGVPSLKNKEIQKLFEEWSPELGLDTPIKSKGKTGGISVSVKDWSAYKDKKEFIKRWVNARTLSKRLGFFDLFKHGNTLHPDYAVLVRTGRTSCIAKGSLIEVVRDVSQYPKGKPIEEVVVGDLAYTFTNDGRLTLKPVVWSGKTGTKRVVRLHWKGTGKCRSGYLDLTEDHPVRLIDGSYVPAGMLQVGARTSALSRGLAQGYAKLYPSGMDEISREHRFIMQEVTGFCGEHVHHRNGNKLDNRISNLENLTAFDHLSYHGKNASDALREFRSKKLKEHRASGKMPPAPKGDKHFSWKGLTKQQVEDAFSSCEWSVVRAARKTKTDFDTFKKYAVIHGFDLEEIKNKSRVVRKDKIQESARHARSVKNNHEVIRIERLSSYVDVYDLEIEDTHNFIANEICVHNCQKPNAQQFPRDAKFRNCFIPSPGKKLFSCLPAGSFVVTNKGCVPIQDVRVGDKAIQEDGSTQVVEAVIDKGIREVLLVETSIGLSVIATKDHRIRIVDSYGSYIWKEIGDLSVGDHVAIQPFRFLSSEYAEMRESFYNIQGPYKSYSLPTFLTEDLALFFGYLTGDGSIKEDCLSWVVNQKDPEVYHKINNLCSKLFKAEYKKSKPYKGVFESFLHRKGVAQWVIDNGVSKERVLSSLWTSPVSVISAFLRGLFESDGCVTVHLLNKKVEVSFSSSRKQIVQDVQLLLLGLGIYSRVSKSTFKIHDKNHIGYKCSIYEASVEKFSKLIGFISKRKIAKLKQAVDICNTRKKDHFRTRPISLDNVLLSKEDLFTLRNVRNNSRSLTYRMAENLSEAAVSDLGLRLFRNHGQIYTKVVSVSKSSKVPVYDLSISITHSYLANGIVNHNCDYSAIELRTLGTICKNLFGKSVLLDTIKNGRDPHCFTAALIDGMTYEEFLSLKGSTKYKESRQASKALNFGVPGGLGKTKLSEYAKANYGVTLTESQAETFRKRLITEIYPELSDVDGYLASVDIKNLSRNLKLEEGMLYDYVFENYGNVGMNLYCLQKVLDGKPEKKDGTRYKDYFIGQMWKLAEELLSMSPNTDKSTFVKDVEKRVSGWKLVKYFFGGTAVTLTGRVRKGVKFTEQKNTGFQGLAADGGKVALFEMVKAGYKVIGFIHDQVLVEIDGTEEETQAVKKIMTGCMEDVLNHSVSVEVEYEVSDSWNK